MSWIETIDREIGEKSINIEDRGLSKSQRFLSFVYDGYTCKWIKIRRKEK